MKIVPSYLALIRHSPSFYIIPTRDQLDQPCFSGACKDASVVRITIPGRPYGTFQITPSIRFSCATHAEDVALGAHSDNLEAGHKPVRVEYASGAR